MQTSPNTPRRFLFVLTLMTSVLACGPGPITVSQLQMRLDDRGPVVLGDGNDDLPADAFLKEQRAESATLSDFIAKHGEPSAVSLDNRFLRSARLALYYPSENKRYLFTRWSSDWDLAGTEKIQANERDAIASQLAQEGGSISAPETSALPRGAELASEPIALPPVATARTSASSGEQELRGRLKPPQAAEEARLVRLPNGDYRHRVTFRGETLRLLADWYTEDPKNVSAIASANRRSPTSPLQLGDEITIPKRLMRNVQALPEAAVS
jgi:hypothetical protein